MHEPLTIQAKSGDAAFLDRLRRTGFRGVVHSVFARAINLLGDDGDLCTMVAADMDDAPNTLVVTIAGFSEADITAGESAVMTDGRLLISDRLAVGLADARDWRMPAPAPAPARRSGDQELRQNLALAVARLHERGTGGGMIAEPNGSAVSRVTTGMLCRAGDDLVDALKRHDLPAAVLHAGRLIGLGPGLTPSGDDFLVGLLAALGDLTPVPAVVRDFRSALVPMSKAATNAISHAAIRAATQGEVRQSVARLLAGLRDANRHELCAAIDAVLAIGSSSGTDIAWGVVCGFDVMLTIGEHAHGNAIRH